MTARWSNLILANFAVPEELLQRYLPPSCEFDRRDGKCWASLVAFQFLDTRVRGIQRSWFRDFPEWNLRFYVTHEGQRGVCFVREFVPSWTVATTARVMYNEPYRSARMTMDVQDSLNSITAAYTVAWKGRTHTLRATGAKPTFQPVAESTQDWFKEHSWGFGTSRWGRLVRYQVSHPTWDVYPVRECVPDVDWALLYGREWGVMNGTEPASVVFAVGSEVSVSPKK